MVNERSSSRPDRRQVLRAGAMGALAVGAGSPLRRRPEIRHVLVVAFAGGVRTKETLGTPANVPTLERMADEGVSYGRVRTANLGHFGATMTLFTGIAEPRGIRENTRGSDPTLFEYVRKDAGLAPGDVWISTSGGAQQANYSHSLHPDYGAAYAAKTVDGDGIFNREFREILAAHGRPRVMEEHEADLLQRMRGSIRGHDGSGRDSASLAEVERYILDELTSGTADLRGTGASDAKALRVARNLLTAFRPRLLGVVLRDADVAHRDFNAYVEVIRRNDRMLGELWEAIRSEPDLAESTAVFVVPEFGRDADLNSRRGLDHGDGSDDLNHVSLVAWGPGFRRGEEVLEEVRTVDLCTTVCDLMGADARYSRGRRLPRLMA